MKETVEELLAFPSSRVGKVVIARRPNSLVTRGFTSWYFSQTTKSRDRSGLEKDERSQGNSVIILFWNAIKGLSIFRSERLLNQGSVRLGEAYWCFFPQHSRQTLLQVP